MLLYSDKMELHKQNNTLLKSDTCLKENYRL